MPRGSVNVKIDEDVKREAEEVLAELGLNMAAAVNIFVRQVIKHGGIPFEITLPRSGDPFYSPANQAYLRAAVKDLDTGRGLVHKTMEELEAMAGE